MYVSAATGNQLAVRKALDADSEDSLLLRRPLPLMMLTVLSRGSTQVEVTGSDQTERQYNLCGAYVQSRFIGQLEKDARTRESTKSRLTWLASHLWQDQVSEIHLEQLWPHWLPSRKWVFFYRLPMSLMTLLTTFLILIDLTKGWNLTVILAWLGIVVIVFFQRRPIDVTTDKTFFRASWLWLVFARIGEIFLVLHISASWAWILLENRSRNVEKSRSLLKIRREMHSLEWESRQCLG